jgi:hypothetical protein
MVRKMGEFPNFVVFNSRTKSFGNSSIFAFSLLLFTLYRFLCLLFECDQLGVNNVFLAVFLDKHERLPPRHHRRGWKVMSHGPASPGVPASAI